MRWTYLLEGVIWFLVMWALVFQVILPIIYRTPWFPILRKKPREAGKVLNEAIEARNVKATLDEAESINPTTNPTVKRKRA